MNKQITAGIGALVIIALAFYGGFKYASAKSPAAAVLGARGGFTGQMGARAGRGGAFAAGTFGQIVSRDDKSITVKLQSGGSRIVFLGASTTVSKMTAGTAADLAVGQNVAVSGSQNSDGSVTATAVDVRPAPAQQ